MAQGHGVRLGNETRRLIRARLISALYIDALVTPVPKRPASALGLVDPVSVYLTGRDSNFYLSVVARQTEQDSSQELQLTCCWDVRQTASLA